MSPFNPSSSSESEAARPAPRSARRAGLLRATGVVAGTLLALVAAALLWCARLVAPAPTPLLMAFGGEALALAAGDADADADAELGYWPTAPLPGRVAAATVAVEDRRFYQHPGVDPIAVVRAFFQNLEGRRRISGASTIAMQVARMQRGGRRTYGAKIAEALQALALTARFGRDRVLEHYLRIAPYGNRIRGVGLAARIYFQKPVADLSWAETAFLAALPQAPTTMNPYDAVGQTRAKTRARRILHLLGERGAVGGSELRLALDQLDFLRVHSFPRRPEITLHAVLRMQQELSAPELAASVWHDPVVRTSIDLDLQEYVQQVAAQALDGWTRLGAGNVAVLVVEAPSGEIRAWLGSAAYGRASKGGAIDFTGVPRGSGSTLKPFLYGYALDSGAIAPNTVLDDLQRGAGGIGNADERFLGPLMPRVALASSRNVPAAHLLAKIGVDTGADYLHRLGLGSAGDTGERYGLGLAVGGFPVTLYQLARAYQALARDGMLGDLVLFPGRQKPVARRVLSAGTARLITLFLSSDQARLPTFPRKGATEFPFAVAVKTGTTSNYHDAWTVAYSKRYLVAAWAGHPDHRPMNRLSGSRSAARLVSQILRHLHKGELDGLSESSFPSPEGYRAAEICALSGKLRTNACERTFVEWFAPGKEPTEACPIHVRLAVDPVMRAGDETTVAQRTFYDLPARYAAWAAASHLPAPPEPRDLAAPGARQSTASGRAGAISITSPVAGQHVLRDPEAPPELSTIELRATVPRSVPAVVWYVDGEAYRTSAAPYGVRWKLRPGAHTVQVRAPSIAQESRPVRITVD